MSDQNQKESKLVIDALGEMIPITGVKETYSPFNGEQKYQGQKGSYNLPSECWIG